MDDNRTQSLYHTIEAGAPEQKPMLDGSLPNVVRIMVYHSKGSGYIVSFDKVRKEEATADRFGSEACDLDFSGKNTVKVCAAPRFNVKHLNAIVATIASHKDEIGDAWLRHGMTAELRNRLLELVVLP